MRLAVASLERRTGSPLRFLEASDGLRGAEPLRSECAVVLVDTLRDAERSASTLEAALEQLADLGPDLGLDEASLLEPLRSNLERLRRTGR